MLTLQGQSIQSVCRYDSLINVERNESRRRSKDVPRISLVVSSKRRVVTKGSGGRHLKGCKPPMQMCDSIGAPPSKMYQGSFARRLSSRKALRSKDTKAGADKLVKRSVISKISFELSH